MGLLTLSDFRDELLLALKQRSDLTDAQLNRWINMGYTWLTTPEVRKHQEMRGSFELTLATGVNNYPIDAGTIGFHTLGIYQVTSYHGTTANNTTERHDVKPRDVEWFEDHRIPSAGGGPRFVLWDDASLTFSPVPTLAENGWKVVCKVWREPTILSADGDVTVLTNYWDEAVILAAQMIAEYRLGLRELAFATRQTAVSYINEKAGGNELQAEDTGFAAEIESETYQ